MSPSSVVEAMGIVLVIVGITMVWLPLGLIVVGASLVAVANLPASADSDRLMGTRRR